MALGGVMARRGGGGGGGGGWLVCCGAAALQHSSTQTAPGSTFTEGSGVAWRRGGRLVCAAAHRCCTGRVSGDGRPAFVALRSEGRI